MPKTECDNCHICQCKGTEMTKLKKDNRRLEKQVAKFEKLLKDVEGAQLFVKDAERLIEQLSSRHCPFMEH